MTREVLATVHLFDGASATCPICGASVHAGWRKLTTGTDPNAYLIMDQSCIHCHGIYDAGSRNLVRFLFR